MENIIIIGGGPAGISAALYAARSGRDPLVIEHGAGGLKKAEKIENYYGGGTLSGQELYDRGIDQAKTLGVRILTAQVVGVEGFDTFTVHTDQGDFDAKAVILATGTSRKAPVIPGLKELEGRGVSYCAVCDAFFYRGKKVAVIGNGDFALKEAEEIGNVASEVTILTNGLPGAFSRKPEYPVRTEKIQNLKGTDFLEGVELADGTGLEVSGVFVAIGTAGSTEIARRMGAELTEKGNIRVDEEMRTTIPGLYAAGDCTGGLLQVVKAVYEGAVAGMEASRYTRPEKAPELAAAEATGKRQEEKTQNKKK